MSKNYNRLFCLKKTLLFSSFILLNVNIFAATTSTTMAVSSTVNSACMITANALNFGTYTTAQLDATTTLSVTCTNTTAYTVGADAGANGSGGTTASPVRNMKISGSGTSLANYQAYTDSGRTTIWNNVSGGNVSGTGTGSAQTITIYGRMNANQYVTPGSYTDTLNITLTFT